MMQCNALFQGKKQACALRCSARSCKARCVLVTLQQDRARHWLLKSSTRQQLVPAGGACNPRTQKHPQPLSRPGPHVCTCLSHHGWLAAERHNSQGLCVIDQAGLHIGVADQRVRLDHRHLRGKELGAAYCKFAKVVEFTKCMQLFSYPRQPCPCKVMSMLPLLSCLVKCTPPFKLAACDCILPCAPRLCHSTDPTAAKIFQPKSLSFLLVDRSGQP